MTNNIILKLYSIKAISLISTIEECHSLFSNNIAAILEIIFKLMEEI